MPAVNVAVVIPWRPEPSREPPLQWVLSKWAKDPVASDVVIGTHTDGPWSKALAVADGIDQAPDADVLIVADADVWCDGIGMAVAAVALGRHQWAIPHRLVYRLKPEPTARVLADGDIQTGPCERRPYEGWAGGGMVVLTRQAWRTAPLDPRYAGWGQEDASWALALSTLCGQPWRGTSKLIHLHHEPQPRWTSVYGSAESRHLWERYRGCENDRAAMTNLIAEAWGDRWLDSATTR